LLPGHERLRERALAFRYFQVNTTPCGPSRSVIYSGQHTQKTRLFVNPNVPPHPELPRDMPTLGSIFGKLGYYPVYKGKWHLSNLNHGINFDQQRYPETSRALEPWGFSFAITLDPRLGPVNQKSQTSTCQLGDSRTKKQVAALRALRNSFSGCKGVTSLPSTQDIPTT